LSLDDRREDCRSSRRHHSSAAIDQFLKETSGRPASKVHPEGDAEVTRWPNVSRSHPKGLLRAGLFRSHRSSVTTSRATAADRRVCGCALSARLPPSLFKFTTTGESGKPRQGDILRTPPRVERHRNAVVRIAPTSGAANCSRVCDFFSLRGQVEFQTFAAVLNDGITDVRPSHPVE
jgi:hypothetical protein